VSLDKITTLWKNRLSDRRNQLLSIGAFVALLMVLYLAWSAWWTKVGNLSESTQNVYVEGYYVAVTSEVHGRISLAEYFKAPLTWTPPVCQVTMLTLRVDRCLTFGLFAEFHLLALMVFADGALSDYRGLFTPQELPRV
jgi:hypothetical protein